MTELTDEAREVLRRAEAFALVARNQRMGTESAEHCRRLLIEATDAYAAAVLGEPQGEEPMTEPSYNPGGRIPRPPVWVEPMRDETIWPDNPRSTMTNDRPANPKAVAIAGTVLAVGFALMLVLFGIAAIIWAL